MAAAVQIYGLEGVRVEGIGGAGMGGGMEKEDLTNIAWELLLSDGL